MKNIVKCYKDFFGYFNALKTHCESNKKMVGTSSHIPIRSGGLAEEFSIQSRIGKLRYLDKLKDLDSASKDIPTNSPF